MDRASILGCEGAVAVLAFPLLALLLFGFPSNTCAVMREELIEVEERLTAPAGPCERALASALVCKVTGLSTLVTGIGG